MASTTPSDWLDFASDDLKNAKILQSQDSNFGACFHAQQAAEKSLKALTLIKGGRIPKVHNLEFLLEKLVLPELEEAGKFLDRFYIESRYPDVSGGGFAEKVPSTQETEQAIKHAQEIFDFASSQLKGDQY